MIWVALLFFAWLFCVSATGLAFARQHWRWWCAWSAASIGASVALYQMLGAVQP